jgi:general secretion pathway protein D
MMKILHKKTPVILILLLGLLLPVTASAKGVILNFTDVDIATMVKFISDLTGKNFVMDERVKGKISVFSPAKLSNEEAFNVFTSVLELKGFTLIQSGKVYKIVPTAAAKQSGTRLYADKEKAPVNESYVARVITLENISAQEAVTFLQPVVSKDGHVSAFGPANMLLVVDSSFNLQKVLALVQMIDAEKRREQPEIIYLKNAGAENIAKVLQDWIGNKSAKQPGQTATASLGTTIVPDTRLNAILVFGLEKDKEEVRKLVTLVDVAPPTSSGKVNVYYLENADATEVAKVLDGVVKGSAAPAQPGQAAAPQTSPFEGGKITITPDKATNSLVIMASPTDYQNLLQVVQKLDRKRRQVFVQALIAEISLDKAQDLGVQWGFFGGAGNSSVAAAGIYDPFGTMTPFFSIVSQLSQAGILPADMKLSSAANFPAILKALQSNGLLNVLSSPTILTSDNKEAEIFVGENVPFAGSSTINSTGTLQSVERKDTGITLKLTPQITEGDYIKLDLQQEISAIKDTVIVGQGSTDRTTTKRSAKTSVIVKDQETVAIGGLISETDRETVSKVPLLGDIPLLGYFFKTKSVSRQKTNLILLLTPRVIKDSRDLVDTTQKQRDRFMDASQKSDAANIKAEIGKTPAESGTAPQTERK